LVKRGVHQIGLVVCDSLSAIETAIWRYFPESNVQLCAVHLHRNVQKNIKPKDKADVANDFKDVFRVGERQDSSRQGWMRWVEFCRKWGKFYPSIGRMAENNRYMLHFTYLDYDHRIHSMIYTTNWIERLNRDYKRTTRMRGALPNPESTILLLGYVAMTRSAYARKIPKINYKTNILKWSE